MDKTVLIVCRTQDDLNLLKRIKQESHAKYIVASDDVRVHKAAEKISWVTDVCWLEKKESFYCVADDVIRILDIVNEWLKSIGKEQKWMPEELFYWIKHCEGGLTTQRIQDLLLLIRSYLYLIEKYQVDEVVILKSPGSEWEDEVLICLAKSKDINVEAYTVFTIERFIKQIFFGLKTYFRDIYYIVNICRIKLRNFLKQRRRLLKIRECHIDSFNERRNIVFLLCSSSLKHIQHTYPLMKALTKRGYHPVALCWTANELWLHKNASDLIEEQGLSADDLENYLSYGEIVKPNIYLLRIWKIVKNKYKLFIENKALIYHDVNLATLLWPSIKFFIFSLLPQRFRFYKASEAYLKIYSPLAVRPWTSILPEGKIFLNQLKTRNSNTLVFANWAFAYNIKNPYNTRIEGRDLELAHGPRHKVYLRKQGVAEDKIVIVGKESQNTISHFKKKITRNDSLNILKVPKLYKIYIGFDANAVLRGYMTSSEFIYSVNFLFEFVKANPLAALIIKPHPSAKTDILTSIYKDYNLPNVFLLDKKMLSYHFLNAIDFLITKFSTLGFEAMEFSKPVISVILDREDNFKIYEDAADYFFEIDSLNMLLTRLLNDNNYREQWKKDHEGRQQKFLLYDRLENIDASELAANEIDRRIKDILSLAKSTYKVNSVL